MYFVFPVIFLVIVIFIVFLQCLSCSFRQSQKVNIAYMHYDYDYDNDKKQDTNSVLKFVFNLQRCVDDFDECEQWSISGFCSRYAPFMVSNCRKSCGTCTVKSDSKYTDKNILENSYKLAKHFPNFPHSGSTEFLPVKNKDLI